jgi:hypothetical protein
MPPMWLCGYVQMMQAERISALEAQHAWLLAALPQPLQQHYWQRHKEAGAAQGEAGGPQSAAVRRLHGSSCRKGLP